MTQTHYQRHIASGAWYGSCHGCHSGVGGRKHVLTNCFPTWGNNWCVRALSHGFSNCEAKGHLGVYSHGLDEFTRPHRQDSHAPLSFQVEQSGGHIMTSYMTSLRHPGACKSPGTSLHATYKHTLYVHITWKNLSLFSEHL